jgi:type I restriction enzyme, S subunit
VSGGARALRRRRPAGSGALPSGWAAAPLADLAVHVLGGEWGKPDLPDADPESVLVRVLRSTEFRDWERDKGATAARRRISRASLARRRLAPGDLVVEISGGSVRQPVGRTLRVDREALEGAEEPLVCSNFCRQVRLHPEVSSAYVQLALTYRYLAGELDAFQTQTTNLRNLDFSAFLDGVTVPLPPASEQERIAGRAAQLLARAAAVRERLARLPALVKQLRQSVLAAACSGSLTEDWRAEQAGSEPFADAFARRLAERRRRFAAECRAAMGQRPPRRPKNLTPGSWDAPAPLTVPPLPPGWSLVALSDVLTRTQQGISKHLERALPGGIPVLRMPNIQEGEVDLLDLKYVAPEAVNVPAFTLHQGDILFNRTNSPELVGKAAVFEADLEALFASYLLRLTCDEQLVVPRYVCYFLNSPWGRAWARAVRTDCVSQSNINSSKLLAMPLPAPPLAEQREIVRQVEAHFVLADRLEARIAAARAPVEQLPRSILARALSGELVATEAELAALERRSYEPGRALLRRIAPCLPDGSG